MHQLLSDMTSKKSVDEDISPSYQVYKSSEDIRPYPKKTV